MPHAEGHTAEMESFGIDATLFDSRSLAENLGALDTLKKAAARSGAGLPAGTLPDDIEEVAPGIWASRSTGQFFTPKFVADASGTGTKLRPVTDLAENNLIRERLKLTGDGADDGTAAARNAATAEGNLSARRAELDEERRQADLDFDIEMRKLDENVAAEQANLDFLERKLALDEEDNRRDDARATQTLITETKLAISSIAEQRNTARANASARNADRSARAAEFNAQQAFQVGLENQRRIEENERQQAAVAEQVAEFGARPGDVTKLVSFLGSNIARGGLGTALEEGADFRTARSVAPLESAQRRETNLAGGPNLLTFDPVQAQLEDLSQFAPIDEAALFNRLFAQLGGGGGGGGTAEEQLGAAVNSALAKSQAEADAAARSSGGTDTSLVESSLGERGLSISELPDFVQRNLRGGMPSIEAAHGFDGIVAEPTNLLVGEGGQPEHVTVEPIGSELTDIFDTGRVSTALLNGGQVGGNVMAQRDALADAGGLPAPAAPQQTAPFGGAASPETINFLNELALDAGRGTIFEGREFVNPVELAAPGTSTGLRELGGAISSAGRGIDPGEFMNLILSLIPRALTEQPLRRTA